MIRISDAVLRVLIALVGACLLLAVASVYGGVALTIGPLVLRSHSVIRPAVLAAILTGIAAIAGRRAIASALTWWWMVIDRYAVAGAGVAAIAAIGIGIAWGTFVAGGSDSYCYLNQAELFARGMVRDIEPLAEDPSWPGTVWAFAPAGHVPLQAEKLFLVPICPAGYSLLMAGARLAGGRTAMFWVTPILGGVTVVLTFILGRRLAGGAAGLLAALLTACSPTFLYQVVQPMNDVPAAAFWTAAVVAALWQPFSQLVAAGPVRSHLADIVAGLLTGIALTVRPNLAPLAAVTAFIAAFAPSDRRRTERLVSLAAFAAAAVPGVAVVMAIQNAIYGSPLRSGYGDLSALFSLSNILPNLQRYPQWVVETHTPVAAAALLAPLVFSSPDARRRAICILTFIAATLACYLPYVVYDAWWYTRFLLPSIPLLLTLTAAVIVALVRRFPGSVRAPVFIAITMAMTATYVNTAIARDAFRLRDLERKFRSAGEYAATLPDNAAFVAAFHTGSIRFYAGRSALGWTDIEPGRLDDALDFLRRHGRKPYLLLEAWEEPDFKARFAGDRLGGLAWPPVAEVDKVKIYDPDSFQSAAPRHQ
jgi:Oligosaccharyl transferase STT3 subunit